MSPWAMRSTPRSRSSRPAPSGWPADHDRHVAPVVVDHEHGDVVIERCHGPVTSPLVPADLRVLSWNLHGLRDDRAALTRSSARSTRTSCACRRRRSSSGGGPRWRPWPASAGCSTSPAAVRRAAPRCWCTCASTSSGRRELPLSRYRLGWPDRGVAAAVVRKSGGRLAVASLHLPLPEPERLDHAQRALAVLRAGGRRAAVRRRRHQRAAGARRLAVPRGRGAARPGTRQRADVPGRRADEAHRRGLRHRPASRSSTTAWSTTRVSSGPATTGRCSSPCGCRRARRPRRGAGPRGTPAPARARAARGTGRCR